MPNKNIMPLIRRDGALYNKGCRISPYSLRLLYYAVAWLWLSVFCGCAPDPLIRNSVETPPMILVPAFSAGAEDGRARFREIYCAVTEKRGRELPDYMPCEDALVKLYDEGPPTGIPVDLGESPAPLKVAIVPGVGWNCFKNFIDPGMTAVKHLSTFGHEFFAIDVEALSGSERNACLIRDAVMAMPENEKRLVLMGYSKGTPDILEAVTSYEDIRERVSAVVSIAGAVGGSPLANNTSQSMLNMMRFFPGSECSPGDEGALESIKPEVRKKWLSCNTLPDSIRYYSLVTFPEEKRISSVLKGAYKDLSQVDSRNDSQVIFYDQVIPGSVVLGFINADHWAAAVPLNRSHPFISSVFIDKNAFPREVLLEAVVRFVEEDLNRIVNPCP